MGINKVWLREEPFARSMERQIDRATLVDLLGIVIYEADRSSKLEDAGFVDQAPSVDCLFDYVLDALGVPPEANGYSREPFNEIFYSDYWLEGRIETLEMVLTGLEELRDAIAARSTNAKVIRANFHLVDQNK
jgi:hypothetical protein